MFLSTGSWIAFYALIAVLVLVIVVSVSVFYRRDRDWAVFLVAAPMYLALAALMVMTVAMAMLNANVKRDLETAGFSVVSASHSRGLATVELDGERRNVVIEKSPQTGLNTACLLCEYGSEPTVELGSCISKP